MSKQEFGVQRVYPMNADPEIAGQPSADPVIYSSRAAAEYSASAYYPDTYRIVVRDVGEWRTA